MTLMIAALLGVTLQATPLAVSSAELYRDMPSGYGRFEARVRFAPADGVVSSFFLWKPDSEMADVFWNEVDIEKIGPDCVYSSNVFRGMPETQAPLHIETEADLCGEYHTHAIEWTPDAIVWFLDGMEVRRVEGSVADDFAAYEAEGLQFRFNVWPGTMDFGGNFDPASLPVHQFVNWVAYYEYAPGEGDGGTDFLPTWREEFDGAAVPAGWLTGSWDSPLGQSTHSPSNVTIVDGMAVLSLTEDDALGFDGEVPADPDDEPGGVDSSGGSPGDSTGDSGSDSGETGGSGPGAVDGGGTTDGGADSCACTTNDDRSGSRLGWLALFVVAAGRGRRTR